MRESTRDRILCESDCGTKPKCKDCSFVDFINLLYESSRLYTELDGDDSGIRAMAQQIVDMSTTEELIHYGEGWEPFYSEVSKHEPIKVRAGYRRGWDLLVVASMSKF